MDRRSLRSRRAEDFAPVAAAAPPTTQSAAAATQTRRANAGIRTRASPSRNKVPPPEPPVADVGLRARRSSRPRSAAGQPVAAPRTTATRSTAKAPTPIKEVNEVSSPVRTHSSFPMTMTTNTSSRAPNVALLTSSVNSPNISRTYSSSTTTTEYIEIRTEGGTGDEVDSESIRKRLTDRLRRSLSKTISTVAGLNADENRNSSDRGSRYSRSVSRSVYDDEDKSSKRSYSTGEEDIIEEEEQLEDEDEFRSFNVTRQSRTPDNSCRKRLAPQEFGGWPGALLLLLNVPALVYYLTWSCTARNGCQLKRPNPMALLDWNYLTHQVFLPHVVGVFSAYQFVVFLLVALLPGRRVHLTRETYKFNGLGVSFTLLLAGGIAEYLKYPVVSFILRHYLRFCIYGLISAFVAAAWSYWRVDTTKYNVLRQTLVNDYGRSGNFVIDFALGRQLNPKWLGRVDWKQYYYRLSLVSTLLYAVCYIYQTLQWPQWPQAQEGYVHLVRYYWQNVNYDAGALLAASSLLLYVLDALIFEHHLSCSFELQHEGYGCLLLLRYAATPYLLSSVSKYFYEQRVPISCWYAPYAVLCLLLLGLGIKRYSCAYKYKYRLNSQHPVFANIETIHTYQGNRLLLSGMWGHLRQPNYLGDIIALCALAAPMILRPAWPPLLSLLLLILVLVHRATRANARNQERYFSSWQRYCILVKYYIIPKVF
ncbi:PREDICTED: lamin-B receptor [Drosophila arizonae]|uniref:Lamin-B receptor n=1 Tax=Drosophila arizonae TaxID=7263 RepID=A0ABM1PKA3_DROAR|nr:PREDICTED: lamin-B receptor [Drosophila arizonae]